MSCAVCQCATEAEDVTLLSADLSVAVTACDPTDQEYESEEDSDFEDHDTKVMQRHRELKRQMRNLQSELRHVEQQNRELDRQRKAIQNEVRMLRNFLITLIVAAANGHDEN